MGDLPPPNAVDIAILVIFLVGLLHGYMRGLSGELAQLAGVVAAFALGMALHERVTEWIGGNTRLDGQAARTAAFIATVIAGIAAMLILRALVGRVMRVVIEERVDKPAGLLAGGVKTLGVVLIVMVVMNLWPHDYLNRKFGEESVAGSLVLRILPSLRETIENVEIPLLGEPEGGRGTGRGRQ